MKEEKLKKLEKELRFLLVEERKKELDTYSASIQDNTNVKDIAKEIYTKRGIDYQKINKEDIMDTLVEFGSIFKNKDSNTKKKMIVDIIYMVLIVILIKVPFDLIRDVGYDYIDVLTPNSILYVLWRLLFLVLYTIVMVSTLILLIRNFNKKYKAIE